MIVTDLSNSFHPVPKQTSQKSSQKSSQIKKKSKKLAKLENNRFSIITNNLDKCYICKKAKKEDLHEVFGGRNRQTSMKYGLVIPVCRKCHNSIPKSKTLTQKLHEVGQKAFEKEYKSKNFIQIFGKSYL
ncbi:MAG: hypothetical protein HFJ26_09875 [Clostridia bacterium]|nr:hypothetical protein [Clostridia bacterium]